MFGWNFEVDAWSRFWRWNLIKICVWIRDMTSRSYFGKINSILGSVVPLAMFSSKLTFKSWIWTSEKRGPSCPNCGHGGGGVRYFGQCPKENVFFQLMSSLIHCQWLQIGCTGEGREYHDVWLIYTWQGIYYCKVHFICGFGILKAVQHCEISWQDKCLRPFADTLDTLL